MNDDTQQEELDFETDYKNLKFKNAQNEEEIKKMKKKTFQLEDKINSLEKEVSDNKQIISRLQYYEDNYRSLSDQLEKAQKENLALKDENGTIKHNFQIEKDQINKRTEVALNMQKAYIDSINSRLGAFEALERLSKVQGKDIQLLEIQGNVDRKEYKYKSQNIKLKSEIKFADFRKKMMDHIEYTQQNVEKLNVIHMDVTSKITMLQNNQLIMQIDSLTRQVEDLISKKSSLEKLIVELKKELEVQKEVQGVLAEKNKLYLNALKNLSENFNKVSQPVLSINNDQIRDIHTSQIDRKNLSEHNSLVNFNNDVNFKTTNSKFFNRSNSYFFNKEIQNKNIDSKKISELEKIIEKKKKEYELLKTNYEIIQDKFNTYELKIVNLYKFLEEMFNDISEEPSIKNTKEFYLNEDKIKNGDFDSLTLEEKYSILSLILKKLIPFISSDKIEENQNIKNVRVKNKASSLNSSISTHVLENNATETIFPIKNGKKFPHKIKFSLDPYKIKLMSDRNKLKIPQNASIF